MSIKKPLSELERVPLREAWIHESGLFTPWLAEADKLKDLADELGISELVLVDTEYRVGDFKLDILCTDDDGRVIIENQLEKSDHAHLGQIITYAAGVGAKKIIWVAESFRPEHAAALQFLNDNTTDDLNFFGVEVKLWRIDNSPLALKFEVVLKPNEWTKSERAQASVAASKSQIMQFWMALIDHLKTEAPQISPHKPRAHPWLTGPIGRPDFGLNVVASTRDNRFSVELYIQGAKVKQHFANLIEQKQYIEIELGFELDWQESLDYKTARISSTYLEASIEDEQRWQEYIDWLTNRLVKMDTVLRPIVKALP